MARSDDKPLVQLIGFQVKSLTAHVEPALDYVEIKERLLGSLDQPLLPQVQVLISSLRHLLLLGFLRASTPILLNLGDRAPAHHKAVVVSIHNVLLLEHKNAIDR